ncbi:MAG: hypothetical protein ACE5I3_07955 [Phycisphaerae bacterium]
MHARLTTLAVAVASLTGCQQTLPSADMRAHDAQARPLPPTLARMQRAYPDLHTGRFVCLADFNTQPQAALFRVLGPRGTEAKGQPTVSVRRAIDETGAGGLKARLTSPNDLLLFDGARSEELALVRDWRDYNLLLFNIYGPPDGLLLEFWAQSGTDLPIRWTRNLFAQPGWHLYRFDLSEIGEELDLADVRALGCRAPELTAPIDLYLDDLILTDNTRYLLGENAAAGELYVVTRGRRIHVGARGRFELAFSDGVIVEWHADNGQNLTVRSGLGPWPLPLPRDWSFRHADPVVYDDPALYANWGARVAAAQRIVEMSEFRVVVAGIWRFLPAPDGARTGPRSATAPEHSWRYVVYPSGQVYVRVTSHARDAGWRAPRLGYALALNGRSGFSRVASGSAYGGRSDANFVLLSQPGRDRPDLLWCAHAPEAAQRHLELVSADERRVAVTVGDVETTDTVEAAHLLRFWPPDIDGAPEAQSFSADYQQPARLTVSPGRAVTDAPGDLNHDGFNESEGCYELEPKAGLLRFRFSPGPYLRHRPIFRVHGTATRDCWVYAPGRIVRHRGRDRHGNLLFTLPRAVSRPLTIEVNTRSRSTPP